MLQVQLLEGEDCGYKVFFESIDVLIMGRKTYKKILSFSNWLILLLCKLNSMKGILVELIKTLQIPEQYYS